MKILFRIILLFWGIMITSGALHAQKKYVIRKNGIGMTGGFTNYLGELNTDASLKSHTSLYGSAFYRHRLYHKTYLRTEGMIGMLRADNRSIDSYENEITGAFRTRLLEVTLKAEYEFLDISKLRVTPYLLAGVGAYILFDYESTMGNKETKNKLGTVIPVGGGVKYKINNRFKIFAEGNIRLLTKNIDNLKGFLVNSNPNTYFTVGAGLIYEMKMLNELW
ncbi:outer membrane protein [Niabella sp. CJ426]|jgi:hypothetical protein|uniref:outer membrane protein n=1 Tax=Niabella sp. CJ426 TaxID=3393740 RepID=UPI003D07DA65